MEGRSATAGTPSLLPPREAALSVDRRQGVLLLWRGHDFILAFAPLLPGVDERRGDEDGRIRLYRHLRFNHNYAVYKMKYAAFESLSAKKCRENHVILLDDLDRSTLSSYTIYKNIHLLLRYFTGITYLSLFTPI